MQPTTTQTIAHTYADGTGFVQCLITGVTARIVDNGDGYTAMCHSHRHDAYADNNSEREALQDAGPYYAHADTRAHAVALATEIVERFSAYEQQTYPVTPHLLNELLCHPFWKGSAGLATIERASMVRGYVDRMGQPRSEPNKRTVELHTSEQFGTWRGRRLHTLLRALKSQL